MKTFAEELYFRLKKLFILYSIFFFIIIGSISSYLYVKNQIYKVNMVVQKLNDYSKDLNHRIAIFTDYQQYSFASNNYSEKKFIETFPEVLKYNIMNLYGLGYASIVTSQNSYFFIDENGKIHMQSLNEMFESNDYKYTRWYNHFSSITENVYVSPQKTISGKGSLELFTVLSPLMKNNKKIGLLVLKINISSQFLNVVNIYQNNNMSLLFASAPHFSHSDYLVFSVTKNHEKHELKYTFINNEKIKSLLKSTSSWSIDLNNIYYKHSFLKGSVSVIFKYNWNKLFLILICLIFLILTFMFILNYLLLKIIKNITDKISYSLSYLSSNIYNCLTTNNKSNVNEIDTDNRDIFLIKEIFSLYKSYRKINKLLDKVKKISSYEGEISLANRLQSKIINTNFYKKIENGNYSIEISAVTRPADKLSGDVYFVSIIESKIYILIGDSTGKNVTAAMYSLFCLASFAKFVEANDSLNDIMFKINQYIVNTDLDAMFLSALLMEVDVTRKSIKYINAGHEEPVIINDKKDAVILTQKDHDIVLGALPNYEYTIRYLSFDSMIDSELYLYTDGITEVRTSSNGEMLGIDGMAKVILNNHAIEDIMNDIIDIEGSNTYDDKTLMKISIKELSKK